LRQEGLTINRKRVVRLLRVMGIEAIYAKPKLSVPRPGHQIFPYLLADLARAADKPRRKGLKK
jgi:putative transposase